MRSTGRASVGAVLAGEAGAEPKTTSINRRRDETRPQTCATNNNDKFEKRSSIKPAINCFGPDVFIASPEALASRIGNRGDWCQLKPLLCREFQPYSGSNTDQCTRRIPLASHVLALRARRDQRSTD